MKRVAWAAGVAVLSTGAVLSQGTWAQTDVAPTQVDWPLYTGDIAGSRYKPLDQINASNFTKLEVAWRFKTDNIGNRPEFKLEGTPLEVGGVVYATAGSRRAVVALDAATRRAALGAWRKGRRARCRRAAPAVGTRPRLLERRQGRAHSVCHAGLPLIAWMPGPASASPRSATTARWI